MAATRLNNTATADTFPDAANQGAATPVGGSFNVIVTNAAVYMSVGVGRADSVAWENQTGSFLPPGGYGFDGGDPTTPIGRVDAVRFRSAAAGVSGRVTVIA